MRLRRRDLFAVLMSWSVVCATGCGGSDKPEIAPVKGTVTYQGKPVENAGVTFTPKKGAPATGQTDAQGVFTLKTMAEEGAAIGENVVTIAKVESQEAERSGEPQRQGPITTPQKSLIPAKYAHPEKSGLKATVEAENENDFKFDLTD